MHSRESGGSSKLSPRRLFGELVRCWHRLFKRCDRQLIELSREGEYEFCAAMLVLLMLNLNQRADRAAVARRSGSIGRTRVAQLQKCAKMEVQPY